MPSRADDILALPRGSGRAGRKNSGCVQLAQTAHPLSARCWRPAGSIDRGRRPSALLDEFAAALAKPAGQLQARIFERAHIGQALTRCAFRGGKEKDSQRTKLTGEVLLCTPEFDWPKRRRTLKYPGRECLCVPRCRHAGEWRRSRQPRRLRESTTQRRERAARSRSILTHAWE